MARKQSANVLCRTGTGSGCKGPDLLRNQAGSREATELSIPNIITLGRILLVPFIVWAIASNQMEIAFAIFVVAGVSDAVDGFLAKRFNMARELGALLDPLADKALLVSKLNTVPQVAFAALVLAALGFGFNSTPYDLILMGFVTVFTLVSVSLYLVEWVRHMSTIEAS